MTASTAAGYLLYRSLLGGGVAGCGPGSGCDAVLGSSWAYVLGAPVSSVGLLFYLSLLGASFRLTEPRSRDPLASRLFLLTLSGAVIAAAIWFTGLQLFVLKAVCKFCCLAHGSALLGSVLLLSGGRVRSVKAGSLPAEDRITLPLRRASEAAALGVMLAAGLAAVQYWRPHRTDLVRLYQGRFHLNLQDVPLIGPSSAPHRIVSLFDYTCPHCRVMHQELMSAVRDFGGQLSIASLPVPLSCDCNPLVKRTAQQNEHACEFARLGLALWKCGHAASAAFDAWVFGPSETPRLEEARRYAESLVGADRLSRELTNAWINRTIQTDMAIYKENSRRLGTTRLPQLIIGGATTAGAFLDADDLINVLQTNLSLSLPVESKSRS